MAGVLFLTVLFDLGRNFRQQLRSPRCIMPKGAIVYVTCRLCAGGVLEFVQALLQLLQLVLERQKNACIKFIKPSKNEEVGVRSQKVDKSSISCVFPALYGDCISRVPYHGTHRQVCLT